MNTGKEIREHMEECLRPVSAQMEYINNHLNRPSVLVSKLGTWLKQAETSYDYLSRIRLSTVECYSVQKAKQWAHLNLSKDQATVLCLFGYDNAILQAYEDILPNLADKITGLEVIIKKLEWLLEKENGHRC